LAAIQSDTKFITEGVRSMFLSTLFFALANVFVKQVGHLPTMEIVFFSLRVRRGVLLRWTATSGRGLEGLEQKIAFAARAFRHDRALFFLSDSAEHSARVGDDDSIPVADFYDDYCDFSVERIG
jgi:hypothetical protein